MEVSAVADNYPNGDGDAVWSEYVGDTIYGDFTVDPYEQDPELMVTMIEGQAPVSDPGI
jgi:hypothetical protein